MQVLLCVLLLCCSPVVFFTVVLKSQSILLKACVRVTLFEVATICVGTFGESNCEIVNHME